MVKKRKGNKVVVEEKVVKKYEGEKSEHESENEEKGYTFDHFIDKN